MARANRPVISPLGFLLLLWMLFMGQCSAKQKYNEKSKRKFCSHDENKLANSTVSDSPEFFPKCYAFSVSVGYISYSIPVSGSISKTCSEAAGGSGTAIADCGLFAIKGCLDAAVALSLYHCVTAHGVDPTGGGGGNGRRRRMDDGDVEEPDMLHNIILPLVDDKDMIDGHSTSLHMLNSTWDEDGLERRFYSIDMQKSDSLDRFEGTLMHRPTDNHHVLGLTHHIPGSDSPLQGRTLNAHKTAYYGYTHQDSLGCLGGKKAKTQAAKDMANDI